MADFVWYNIADEWTKTPVPRSRALQNNFQHLQYIQPRYFSDKRSAKQAKAEVRSFNVRRKFWLERDQRMEWADDKYGECALIGASAGIWIRPNRNQHRGWLGIILMDPVIMEGYPLWGGYANLRSPPSMHDDVRRSIQLSWTPGRQDLITWIRLLWETSPALREDQNYLTSPLYELVATQYLLLFELVKTRLTQTEYELEVKTKRSWNKVLSKIYPWRRQLPIYKARIKAILESLQDHYGTAPHWRTVIETYEQALNINDELISRANGILETLTAVINIEEAQNARIDAQDVSRITYLAFIFVPLSFVSGFLSMNTEFAEGNITVYWVYFAIAVPLSCLAVIVAAKWSAMIRLWEGFVKKPKEDPKEPTKLSEKPRGGRWRPQRSLGGWNKASEHPNW